MFRFSCGQSPEIFNVAIHLLIKIVRDRNTPLPFERNYTQLIEDNIVAIKQ